MLSPKQVVRILVFIGLTKPPLEAPRQSISVQKDSASSYATDVEMSSMYTKRCGGFLGCCLYGCCFPILILLGVVVVLLVSLHT